MALYGARHVIAAGWSDVNKAAFTSHPDVHFHGKIPEDERKREEKRLARARGTESFARKTRGWIGGGILIAAKECGMGRECAGNVSLVADYFNEFSLHARLFPPSAVKRAPSLCAV